MCVSRGVATTQEESEAEMEPETRARLDEFFRPQKEALVAMFGDEKLRWDRPY